MVNTSTVRQVRSLFLSDVHLGIRQIQIERLLDFLDHYEAETIYLVGDILDIWRLNKKWRWPESYDQLTKKLMARISEGTRVIYLPGNHDEYLREHLGVHFASEGDGLEIVDTIVHDGADGKRYLVLHGDQFDLVVQHAKWLAHLGDWAYNSALWANSGVNFFRRKLGLQYWSLAAWAKDAVKNAVSFIGRYEEALAQAAKEQNVDGVICGHIHHAVIHDDFGIVYINCGDWVESCTAITEDFDGNFELVTWRVNIKKRKKKKS